MGLFRDLLLAAQCEEHERDIKEAYGMGFRDGRLCPAELRPCLVDGKPALFHQWVEEDQGLLRVHAFMKPEAREKIYRDFKDLGICGPAGSIEKLRTIRALVEWPDGSVSTVPVKLVQFTDRRE